jgi:hypothetical protein
MKYACLLLLFFIPVVIHAQTGKESIQLIEYLIRQKQDTAMIIYIDSIRAFDKIESIKQKLAKRRFKGFGREKDNSIVLTKKERAYIFDQLYACKNQVWGDSLFAHSIRISENDCSRYLRLFAQARQFGRLKSGNQYWRFTRPVFIREGSVALIGIMYMCGGLCGEEELSFYKKTGSRWQRWVMVSGGVF